MEFRPTKCQQMKINIVNAISGIKWKKKRYAYFFIIIYLFLTKIVYREENKRTENKVTA